jgi:riboflavin kinase/FMN adenylyltransferase
VNDVQVWRSLEAVPEAAVGTGCVVSIGVFDGVHRGHQEVLAVARALAEARGLPMVVLTFDPHPVSVVRPGAGPPMVCTLRRRLELLAAAEADAVLVLPFTAHVSAMSPDGFVREVLVERLHARVVVVGEDFRFGHRAAGDVAVLDALGLRHGFDAIAVGPVGAQGSRWSSTQVRDAARDGDVGTVRRILGHDLQVEGVVVAGDRRGRDLGYPTANLQLPADALVPADGVYAGRLLVLDGPMPGLGEVDPPADDPGLPAAVSVGSNPTFDGADRRVEAYVLDHDDLDLYGRLVAVRFVQRLRGQVRFESAAALVSQMAHDVAGTRVALGLDHAAGA